MNLLRRNVTRGGRRIERQPREFQLLEYFMHHTGRVVTRAMLLEAAWDFHFDPKTNIDDTISAGTDRRLTEATPAS